MRINISIDEVSNGYVVEVYETNNTENSTFYENKAAAYAAAQAFLVKASE